MSEQSVPVSNDPSLPILIALFVATMLCHALFILARAGWKPVRRLVRRCRARHYRREAAGEAEADAYITALRGACDGHCLPSHHCARCHGAVSERMATDVRAPWAPAEAPARVERTMVPLQCDVDWGSATATQRCVRPDDHFGVHIDADGREWGYVPNEDDPWGSDEEDQTDARASSGPGVVPSLVRHATQAHVMSSSPGHYSPAPASASAVPGVASQQEGGTAGTEAGQESPAAPLHAEPEPVPPGELAPWVKEALGGHDSPGASLDSIVARVVRDA